MSEIVVHKVNLRDVNGEDWDVPKITRGNKVKQPDDSGETGTCAKILELIENLGEGEAIVVWRDI